MKRMFLFGFLICFALLTLSCEENISPNGKFQPEYVLYCLINADSTFQTAYISSSYKADNCDPNSVKSDPALTGAYVYLIVNGHTVYKFQEGTTVRSDTSRYGPTLKYYYTDYKPIGGDRIEIKAALMNGGALRSTLIIPNISYLRLFPVGAVPYNPANIMNKSLDFIWLCDNVYSDQDYYFYSRLQLVYTKDDEPGKIIKVTMPIYYATNYGSLLPVYPKLSKDCITSYFPDGIKNFLESISAGDEQKDKYTIHECEFTLKLAEKNLADYMAAISDFQDEFSIRIDPTEWSNIENGHGVFGAYSVKKAKLKIDKNFIASLGYKTSY